MPPNPEYLAWLNAEYLAGRMKSPHTALGQLRAHPRTFLRQHPISNTWDRPATGAINAYLCNGGGGHRPGSILKTTRMHAAETFNLSSALGLNGDGCAFLAFGLQTDTYNGVGNIVWHTLPTGGADILITARLTGCTFAARATLAGGVEVTHQQPNEGVYTGLQVHDQIRAIAGVRSYGRNDYDFTDRAVNVIGVRVGGAWKIYAQKLEKFSLSIRNVERIWPE
jgi:hypothetical protein